MKFKDCKEKTCVYGEFALCSSRELTESSFSNTTCIFPFNRDEVNTIKTRVQGKCQETESLQKKIEENVSMLFKAVINRNMKLYKDSFSENG